MAASFVFSNRQVSPTQVRALENITASVDVTNTGDAAGSVDVHLTGWWVLTRSAYPSWLPDNLPPVPTIQPGGVETVTFTFFPSIAMGAHDDCPVYLEGVLAGYVDVVVDTPPAKATLTVYTDDDSGNPVAANVAVGSLSGATAGGSWTVELDPGNYLVNFGGLQGYTAPASQSVTLVAGESMTVTGVYVLTEEPEAVLRFVLSGGPSQAQVYIDENLPVTVHSGTPLEVAVAPGPHYVDFEELDGYNDLPQAGFTVSDGQVYVIPVSYVPIVSPPAGNKLAYAGAGLVGLLVLAMALNGKKRR
jgi:hypothetical protein